MRTVREGKPWEDPVGHDLDWLNRRECDSGEMREVVIRVRPSRRGVPATVVVDWPYGTSRDLAHWQVELV